MGWTGLAKILQQENCLPRIVLLQMCNMRTYFQTLSSMQSWRRKLQVEATRRWIVSCP